MLKTENLSLRFPGREDCLLEGIDLTLRKGSITGLTGPSGGGKTLLGLVAAGVIPAFIRAELSGSVRLDLPDGQDDGQEYRTRSAIVFQDPSFQLFSRTVHDELLFTPRNLGWPGTRVKGLFSSVVEGLNLEGLLAENPRELSMGETQRVALGAALMQMPHILVLDEPTQYADHSNLRSSLQFVADWAARFDMAVLLIEHNLPLLSRFCERVFIMERGRLRQGLPEAASFPQCRPRDLNGCKPLIELKEVHYSYRPGKPVLRGADLKIYRSEAVALLGPNGSGKSTLAKIICGLYKPGSGTVRFEGREMSASQERFKRIGLVMQNPDQQLFAPTVMEECSFGPRNFRLPESRYRPMISARLGEFQMGEFEQRDPFSLSYGEKRRVNVTGILACEPDVLILDEPTCALDTENQRILLDLVLKLKSRGKTIIVITHDLNFARAVCTRALLVSRGRIVKDLPMNEIGVREESGERGESGVKYVVS